MEQKTYFISADIEGVTDVTDWCETEKGQDGYEDSAIQMTKEVAAACQAIIDAGHKVVVRDGHMSARNIKHSMLPRGVMLMRGWAAHPGSMVAGISDKYAGILYIGYHSPAGTDGNPLAHTVNHDLVNWIKIDGKIASEFTLNSLYAAQCGVPSIFLSGDKMMCDLAQEEVPRLVTVAVKEGRGNSTFNVHPEDACEMIKRRVSKAIDSFITLIQLKESYTVEINLKDHAGAREALEVPHMERIDPYTVRFTAKSPKELSVLRQLVMK